MTPTGVRVTTRWVDEWDSLSDEQRAYLRWLQDSIYSPVCNRTMPAIMDLCRAGKIPRLLDDEATANTWVQEP